jgi:hypothetical protein
MFANGVILCVTLGPSLLDVPLEKNKDYGHKYF